MILYRCLKWVSWIVFLGLGACSSPAVSTQKKTAIATDKKKIESKKKTEPQVAEAPLECKVLGLPQRGLRVERIRLHTPIEQELNVELAIASTERQIGMMCRTEMPADTGMLFIFSKEKRQRFWMKNTLLPLDMVFIDRDGLVVGIVSGAKPLDLRSRGVSRPSQFVLELVAGEALRRGLKVGHRVEWLFDLTGIAIP